MVLIKAKKACGLIETSCGYRSLLTGYEGQFFLKVFWKVVRSSLSSSPHYSSCSAQQEQFHSVVCNVSRVQSAWKIKLKWLTTIYWPLIHFAFLCKAFPLPYFFSADKSFLCILHSLTIVFLEVSTELDTNLRYTVFLWELLSIWKGIEGNYVMF